MSDTDGLSAQTVYVDGVEFRAQYFPSDPLAPWKSPCPGFYIDGRRVDRDEFLRVFNAATADYYRARAKQGV